MAPSRPVISIEDVNGDRTALLEEIRFYSKELGFDSTVYIRINYTLNLSESVKATLGFKTVNEQFHQVVIYVNQRLNPKNQSLAIAHELVHARQYLRKDLLQLSSGRYTWQGGQIVNIRRVPYMSRPWEIEAHDLSEKLVQAYSIHDATRNQWGDPTSDCFGDVVL